MLPDIYIFKPHILNQRKSKIEAFSQELSRIIWNGYSFIQDNLFKVLRKNFGKPTFDMSTLRVNQKLRRFFSFYLDPMALRVGAFFFDWGQEITFAFSHLA